MIISIAVSSYAAITNPKEIVPDKDVQGQDDIVRIGKTLVGILQTVGIVLSVIVLIVIGIKAIYLMNRVNTVVDDVEKKVHSFDRAFELLNFTTDKITNITDSLITKVTNFISGFGRKKKTKRYVEEEYDDEL